jgi:hypothetical protein
VLLALAGRSPLDPDPSLVSPGIFGFAAFFFMAVALYFLVKSMNARLRNVRFRQAELDAQEAERAQAAGVKDTKDSGAPSA